MNNEIIRKALQKRLNIDVPVIGSVVDIAGEPYVLMGFIDSLSGWCEVVKKADFDRLNADGVAQLCPSSRAFLPVLKQAADSLLEMMAKDPRGFMDVIESVGKDLKLR